MTNKIIPFPQRAPASGAARGDAMTASSAAEIAERLSAGSCPEDAAFDQFIPESMRAHSCHHWTPLAVALRAAEWFSEHRVRTVVDIGSGAGKFCVGAALAGYCHFTGLEQRERLVAGARLLARTFSVESRVHFIHGVLGVARLPVADAYYLYNPFLENRMYREDHIDEDVELSEERQARDVLLLRELLSAARPGTYVLTYNGIDAKLPASYRLVCSDRELPNALCLWRKAVPRAVAQGVSSGLD
jgi:SAM-dependent methyltransferase